ncbi:MAG TPA: NADH-quinone oxidoreductase subunit N [Xanthomonadales bacterium]|nr:NADH-quinone oxidoreductase subunit N [Xanthomonadales bacterium]
MIAAAVTHISGPRIDWLAIAPEIALGGAGVLIVLAKALMRRRPRVFDVSVVLAFAGAIVAAVFVGRQWVAVHDDGAFTTIRGMVAIDGFGVFLSMVVLIATALALFASVGYLKREGLDAPEYLALMLLSATGMLAMTTAGDLIVVFLALEILSIPLYVLAGFDRRRLTSQEAGLKYFVLGAFSSAVFLYGIALTYGATGTTSLAGIAQFLAGNTIVHDGVLVGGLALLLVGLGFKVAASPFHMWTPDVYQGAPTPVTAFMGSATKAAGFAALLRVLITAFGLYKADWHLAIFGLATLSLVVGSVAGLVQRDIKRLLAYSSIAHAGYVLMGLEAATSRGTAAALMYLFVYTFMIIGAFTVVMLISRRGDDRHAIDDYRGLSAREPVLAGALTFFLLAQAGMPFTGGFVVKLQVFAASVQARQYAMALIGVLAAVIAAFYYLRVVVAMYLSDAEEASEERALPLDAGTALVLVATIGMTLWIGFLPGTFLHFARDATLIFRG